MYEATRPIIQETKESTPITHETKQSKSSTVTEVEKSPRTFESLPSTVQQWLKKKCIKVDNDYYASPPVCAEALASFRAMTLEPTDVVINTFPKCGN